MISIFYRHDGEILLSQSATEFASISKEEVLWIDLLSPTGDEKRAAEAFLGTEIQSRATAEEIESSSRFSENETGIFINTNFLSPSDDEMSMDPVSFTIVDGTLTTLREIPLRSFTLLQRRIQARPAQFPNGFSIFTFILDQRVDLDADIIELMSKDAAIFSRRINQQEDINEEFLIDINQLQENALVVRENVVDKQRVISNILKSDRYPEELEPKLNVILQDIASLLNHINFTFERLEYLQDTAEGLINLEQNRIMKIFTILSALVMPATLIASFYGMNVQLPFAEFGLAWVGISLLMLLTIGVIFFIAKKNKML